MLSKLILVVMVLFIAHFSSIGQDLTGLWQVEKVQVGDEKMTPIARWMRFDEDGTQESGNGWLKHSEGNYEFNAQDSTLKMVDINGTADNNPPFQVDVQEDQMTWTRIEGGQEVFVRLKPIDQLPASPANKLLGVWEINQSEGNLTGQDQGTFFIRWDNVFVYTHPSGEKKYGVYKCHGHKNEIELIYYGEDCRREWWAYAYEDEGLKLVQTKDENQFYVLNRINEFPY
jgi:hypothetical protein